MKNTIILLTFLSASFLIKAEDNLLTPKYLNSIRELAFGEIGLACTKSEGEILFVKIISKENPLKQFNRLYDLSKGNNQAQMYAVIAFYYLDKLRYAKIKNQYKNRKASIVTMKGCGQSTVDIQVVFKKIEAGLYESYIPQELRQEK